MTSPQRQPADGTQESALGLDDVAQQVLDAASGDYVSVGDLMSEFGRRAFGPLLLAFGMLSLSPLGSIPGASIVFGALIFLIAVQLLFDRRSPWMPSKLSEIDIESSRVRKAVCAMRPSFRQVDRFLKPRWPIFARSPSVQVIAVLCVVLAATMYPLALVPWGVAVPSFAIIVLGLGLTSQDGLVLSFGMVISMLAVFGTAVFFL
jgi:hypothetical protein